MARTDIMLPMHCGLNGVVQGHPTMAVDIVGASVPAKAQPPIGKVLAILQWHIGRQLGLLRGPEPVPVDQARVRPSPDVLARSLKVQEVLA